MTPRNRSDGALTFEIEGALVRCEPLGRRRLWHCDCGYFERMRGRHGKGFCPHVAVAIEHAAETGLIDFEEQGKFSVARQSTSSRAKT